MFVLGRSSQAGLVVPVRLRAIGRGSATPLVELYL